MKPTDIQNPDTFHRVVDCQWACPADTLVPEYIRMIAAGRYADAYMGNWRSNADRCPIDAWNMQKFLFQGTPAGPGCRSATKREAA